MNQFCFLNGAVIPQKEAVVPVTDIGLMRAYGVYDGIAAFDGKPFLFTNHYERFVNSAQALDIALPYSKEVLHDAIVKVLQKNNQTAGRATLRALATAGETVSGIEFLPGHSTVAILAETFAPLAQDIYESGGALITYEYMREFPAYKTINYITGVTLQKKRKDAGAVEILYVKDGYVRECATSNIVIVKGGTLITPVTHVLPGITRKLVVHLAQEKGMAVEEREVSMAELWDADEVFITSSFKDIVPIVSIDTKPIGAGMVGSVTRSIMRLCAEYVASGKGLDLETRI